MLLVPFLLAAQPGAPLPEVTLPTAPQQGALPMDQLVPILAAALLVLTPLFLLLSVQRRRKRKRMGHRPRNPTLADTGGLPPARPPS